MTERNFTDEQIIKALECCANTLECRNCPLIDEDNCTYRNINYVLDLINRQRAELKALKMDNDQLQSDIVNATMNLESVQHELDKAREEIEGYQHLKVILNTAVDKLRESLEAEVARGIFEDIDSKISCFFPVSSFVNAPHTTHYRLLDMLAELKKKYTEEKE